MRTEADGNVTYFPLDHPHSEVAVAWYLELTPESTGNVMAMVFRDGPDQPWKLVVRTRMYVDDKLGDDSKDRRKGMMVEALPEHDPDTCRRELTEKGDDILGGLLALGLGKLWRQAGHASTQEFLRIWSEQPWAHVRSMTPEEHDALRAKEARP